jgi:hypothetical protein
VLELRTRGGFQLRLVHNCRKKETRLTSKWSLSLQQLALLILLQSLLLWISIQREDNQGYLEQPCEGRRNVGNRGGLQPRLMDVPAIQNVD